VCAGRTRHRPVLLRGLPAPGARPRQLSPRLCAAGEERPRGLRLHAPLLLERLPGLAERRVSRLIIGSSGTGRRPSRTSIPSTGSLDRRPSQWRARREQLQPPCGPAKPAPPKELAGPGLAVDGWQARRRSHYAPDIAWQTRLPGLHSRHEAGFGPLGWGKEVRGQDSWASAHARRGCVARAGRRSRTAAGTAERAYRRRAARFVGRAAIHGPSKVAMLGFVGSRPCASRSSPPSRTSTPRPPQQSTMTSSSCRTSFAWMRPRLVGSSARTPGEPRAHRPDVTGRCSS